MPPLYLDLRQTVEITKCQMDQVQVDIVLLNLSQAYNGVFHVHFRREVHRFLFSVCKLTFQVPMLPFRGVPIGSQSRHC